jgi:glycosyltransferase involved in cell wall biosynthesis
MSRDSLNVCLYTPTSHGGHALYTQELLTALAEVGPGCGVAPELVTCEDHAAEPRPPYPVHRVLPRQVPREEFSGTAAWAASRVGYYTRRERVFLDWLARRPDVDVVHFQEYTPWLAPRHFRALRRRGVALVFTVHNIRNHYNKFFMHAPVRDFCFRRAWRICDALLVHTEGLREALSRFLGGTHPPIHVTPHGVWHGNGRAAGPWVRNGALRDRLLFFGVIRPNKGVHVLLRALERLPGCDLTIAGEAEEPGYLEQVRGIAGRFPPGRVELIDRYVSEDEVADLFRRSHLVVLPYTNFTSQSGVLHQALAHERPVVATDVGALGECVRRWGIGGVVPPDDVGGLAQAVGRSLEPAAYAAAADAVARVRGELTWTRTAEATIGVYRSVVG